MSYLAKASFLKTRVFYMFKAIPSRQLELNLSLILLSFIFFNNYLQFSVLAQNFSTKKLQHVEECILPRALIVFSGGKDSLCRFLQDHPIPESYIHVFQQLLGKSSINKSQCNILEESTSFVYNRRKWQFLCLLSLVRASLPDRSFQLCLEMCPRALLIRVTLRIF